MPRVEDHIRPIAMQDVCNMTVLHNGRGVLEAIDGTFWTYLGRENIDGELLFHLRKGDLSGKCLTGEKREIKHVSSTEHVFFRLIENLPDNRGTVSFHKIQRLVDDKPPVDLGLVASTSEKSYRQQYA